MTDVKNTIDCPFKIKFSKIHYRRPVRRFNFYKARITGSNFIHSHDLSARMYRKGYHSSKVHIKINVATINNAVAMLKFNPRLKSTELRALLYDAIPMGIAINAKFLANLRKKVMLYHANL